MAGPGSRKKSWIWTRFGVHAETIQTFPRLYPIFSLSASSWLSFVSGKNVSKKLGFSVHDILTLCTYFFRSLALIPTHVLTVKIHSMESNPLKEIVIPNIWSDTKMTGSNFYRLTLNEIKRKRKYNSFKICDHLPFFTTNKFESFGKFAKKCIQC